MIQLVAYSDYLCPWCYNVAVRLERLARENEDVRVQWKSYLLRARPQVDRDLEAFREYTRSWMRPAKEADSGSFRIWEGDAGPPSHSIPPHLVAKAAARLGPEAFEEVHRRLLHAYFAESRDITDDATLRALWAEAGLPESELAHRDDPELLRQVQEEHREAVEAKATGVPAVRLADGDIVIVGAHPYSLYERWVEKARQG